MKCSPLRYTLNVYFRRSAAANHRVLQEFENALKDVVSTKRASVSKMTRLNEAAKKCFEVRFASSTGYSKTKPISAHLLPFACPAH